MLLARLLLFPAMHPHKLPGPPVHLWCASNAHHHIHRRLRLSGLDCSAHLQASQDTTQHAHGYTTVQLGSSCAAACISCETRSLQDELHCTQFHTVQSLQRPALKRLVPNTRPRPTHVSIADHPDACSCCPDLFDQLRVARPVQDKHRHIPAAQQEVQHTTTTPRCRSQSHYLELCMVCQCFCFSTAAGCTPLSCSHAHGG